jgi:hypothetical protein
MLRQLLLITGLEERLQAAKRRVEARAEGLIQHSKAVATQVAVASALATIAVVVLLLAVVCGLAALFMWLKPQVGELAATGIVGGLLLALAAILAICAAAIFRKETPMIAPADIPIQPVAPDAGPDVGLAAAPPETFAAPPRRPVSVDEVDAIFSLAGRYGSMPQTGIEPIDNLVRAVAPKAEEATKEALARAANLVREGDRTTVFTILGAAVAAGWLLTKAHQRTS